MFGDCNVNLFFTFKEAWHHFHVLKSLTRNQILCSPIWILKLTKVIKMYKCKQKVKKIYHIILHVFQCHVVVSMRGTEQLVWYKQVCVKLRLQTTLDVPNIKVDKLWLLILKSSSGMGNKPNAADPLTDLEIACSSQYSLCE